MFDIRKSTVEVLNESGFTVLPSPRYEPTSIEDLSSFYKELLEAIYNYESSRIIFPESFWSKTGGLDFKLSLVDIELYFDYLWIRGHLDRYELYDCWQARHVYAIRGEVVSYFYKPAPKPPNKLIEKIKSILNFRLW